MITTPSTVGVRPPTSSTTSLSRSPPGARNEIAGVLSSDGVVPAVPPAWIGVLSWIVSEAENTVRRVLVPVDRMSRMIEQGYGVHSYCHPASGLNPSWFAVSACENTKLGILPSSPRFSSYPHGFDSAVVRAQILQDCAVGRVATPGMSLALSVRGTRVYVKGHRTVTRND